MRFRVLALVAWLLFFYNLERVHLILRAQQIQLLTRYAYVFVALVALIALALPGLHRVPLALLVIGEITVFLVIKALLGYPLWGAALPVTVTEICAVLVTGMLARQVILAIREFETSIVDFTIKRVGRPAGAFAVEQGDMYQEVRRARAYSRPLALVAIEPTTNSFRVTAEKMVEEVQRATMKQYVLAALAKTLDDHLSPYNTLAQDGDRFLIMLPETAQEDIPRLTAEIRSQVHESIGVELRIGTATLPGVDTFDELVEAAYVELKSKIEEDTGEAATPTVTSVSEGFTSQ